MSRYAKVTLLDGGMGQEIVNRGGKSGYGEWSLAALHENPTMVQDIHTDYLLAGADVITTNTYSTTRTRLKHMGMEDRLPELVNVAGQLATTAREQTGYSHVKIAGSLSPLEASYISDFQLSFDEMVAQYREIMTLLEPYVDIYLAETLATIHESRAFLTAAQSFAKPIWVSWTLHDHGKITLRGGETIVDVLESLAGFSADAILVNCCTTDSIEASLPYLQRSGLAFGAYANGFVEVPQQWYSEGDVANQIKTRTDLTPDVYADHAKKWLRMGASIVGGCCEVGPAHIAHLSGLLNKPQK